MTGLEEKLAECLADYRARRAAGEAVSAAEYASRLGERYAAFAEVVEAELVIDELIEAPAAKELPRNFGAFELVRELGRGAGGVVYEAEQSHLHRTVAVKLLRDGFENDPLAREHFLREAGICAQLKHANIVDIYEAGEVDGVPFFAMERIEGTTLGAWMQGDKRSDVKTLFARIADVADALSQLHELGIVHRDIKPSNIMVASDGRFLLTDFGMARTELAETLARSGVALGTPLCMSPEQLLGKRREIDGRSDVYGLGATLFECLTGRPPFETDDANALVRMILHERPQSPDALASCGADASRVVLKCLEKKPADRYANAAELRDDLRRLARGEPVLGRPLGMTTRMMRVVVGRPRVSLVVAASLLVACVLAWHSMTRPGWLNADIMPDGVVRIESSGSWGEAITAPLRDHELAPGEYRVLFESRGFYEQEATVRVTPGDRIERVVRLKVKDPNDPDVLARVCRAMGIARGSYAEPPKLALQRSKGVNDVYAYPLWPRGKVRIEDLDAFQACIGVDYDKGEADLVFKIGDEVVYRDADFDPEDMLASISVSDRVAKRLRAAERFSWGFEIGDRVMWATCEVVQAGVSEKLAVLDEMLPTDDRASGDVARARALLAARVLHAAGLYTAAWKATQPLVAAGAQGFQLVEAQRIRYDALTAVAGADLAELKKAPPYRAIVTALMASK